jgi:hypothetical protein
MRYIFCMLLLMAPLMGWTQTKRPPQRPPAAKPAVVNRCVLPSQGAMMQVATDMLRKQSEAWNEGDLETFMQDYWQSDSLRFIGRSGVVLG